MLFPIGAKTSSAVVPSQKFNYIYYFIVQNQRSLHRILIKIKIVNPGSDQSKNYATLHIKNGSIISLFCKIFDQYGGDGVEASQIVNKTSLKYTVFDDKLG